MPRKLACLWALLLPTLVACPPPPTPSSTKVTPPRPQPSPGTNEVVSTSSTAAVVYRIGARAPQTHHAEVSATFVTSGRSELTLMMPVWTPGSYMVREYAKHVETLTASAADGRGLPVEKISKNRFRIATGGNAHVTVHYRLYARDRSVRGNFVDADYALFNGAATYLTDTGADPTKQRQEVSITLPRGWRDSVTALDPHPDGAPHHYVASSFDELVDTPIFLGNPDRYTFEADGTPHELVIEGGGDVWDGPRSREDAKKIAEAVIAFWGTAPYRRFVIFNILNGASGGLEHLSSTVLMSDRWVARDRNRYQGWWSLLAHELFHAWNGKRLRPAPLGPFDYEQEAYTRDLWIVEGLTTYYAPVLLKRAGLLTRDELFQRISGQIRELESTPGRTLQSLEMSSHDSWIKYYREDENTKNSAVSYYNKGAVVGFLLDAHIRQATGNDRSLDDVMRAAYQRWSGPEGYAPGEWAALVEETAGPEVRMWMEEAVSSTKALDYEEALDWFGLRFKEPSSPKRDDEKAEDARERERKTTYLGVETKVTHGGRLVVSRVERDTPAYRSGLNVEDEIIAIDGYRISTAPLSERIQQYLPGDRVDVLVARRGMMRSVPVTLTKRPDRSFEIETKPIVGAASRSRLSSWLGEGW